MFKKKADVPCNTKELRERLDNLPLTPKLQTIWCGKGLSLRVWGLRKRNTAWVYRRNANRKLIKLGSFPEMDLEDAIAEVAAQDPELLKIDIDSKNITFGELAAIWLEQKKDLARYLNIKKDVENLKTLSKLKVTEISNLKIKRCLLDPRLNLTPYKIHETLGTLCSIMDLAVEDEIIDFHRCRLLSRSNSFPKHVRGEGYRYVLFPELPELFEKLGNLPFGQRMFFLMLCLTCLRPGECRKLKFSYFDILDEEIRVPGEIMKIKRREPFRIPLTKEMLLVLKAVKRNSPEGAIYLFRCRRKDEPLQERDLSQAIKMATAGQVQAHGFRKTSRSWFAEQEVSMEVAAKCLDHSIYASESDRFYQKSDLFKLRKPVMEKWSAAVFGCIDEDLYFRDDHLKI